MQYMKLAIGDKINKYKVDKILSPSTDLGISQTIHQVTKTTCGCGIILQISLHILTSMYTQVVNSKLKLPDTMSCLFQSFWTGSSDLESISKSSRA